MQVAIQRESYSKQNASRCAVLARKSSTLLYIIPASNYTKHCHTLLSSAIEEVKSFGFLVDKNLLEKKKFTGSLRKSITNLNWRDVNCTTGSQEPNISTITHTHVYLCIKPWSNSILLVYLDKHQLFFGCNFNLTSH